MDLGRVGLFSGHLNLMTADRAGTVLREIESMGYGTVWVPESAGKEVLTHCAVLLARTKRIVVASAIANIWVRDPMAMVNGARTLEDAYPDRFLLGVGIGHPPSVKMRGHDFAAPVKSLREYLQAMDRAPFRWPTPVGRVKRVVGALGPKMLELSAELADGAIPYLVPVEHTASARQIMGKDAILAPELAVVLTTDADKARRIAREHFANYLALDNYRNSLRRSGWNDEDMRDGGSDRLVDSLVAWGEPEVIKERTKAHLEAGADHVAIQVLGPEYGWSAWSYSSVDQPMLRQGENDFPMEDARRVAEVLAA